MASVRSGLGESLANPRRLHGRWAQDLFRAVLISIDAAAPHDHLVLAVAPTARSSAPT